VCNLSPEAASCGETLSSLNFASRAAQVELGQTRRVTGSATAGTSSAVDTTGPSISPEPSSSSIRGVVSAPNAAGGSGEARGGMRPKSPVFAGSSGMGRAGGVSPGGASAAAAAGAAGPGARPASRLSDRTSGTGPGLGAAGSAANPRVSMAKPARH
jgi:hypothetical protein